MRTISHFIPKKIKPNSILCGGSSDYKKPSLNTLESFSQNELCLSSREYILRISPARLKFSGFFVLSIKVSSFNPRTFSIQSILLKLCIEMYAGFSVSDLTEHHFMCFNFSKISAHNSELFAFFYM